MIHFSHNTAQIDLPFYTEGPVADEYGNYYFTSLNGGAIFRINVGGKIQEWANTTCPNGQCRANNLHYICDSAESCIFVFDSSGRKKETLIKDYFSNEKLYVPNDIICDSKNNLYFTDSIRFEGKLCMYTYDQQEIILAGGLDYPNGLALSRDEKKLYVSESYQNRILEFQLDTESDTFNKYVEFARLPDHSSGIITNNLPDGIKVDREGNVWVAHYGMGALQVISSKGVLINSIKTNIPLTSNLFIRSNKVFVTGGFAQPGPGAINIINL